MEKQGSNSDPVQRTELPLPLGLQPFDDAPAKNAQEHFMEDMSVLEPEVDAPDPSQVIQLDEVSELIAHTLESLPERTRKIFRMNRQEGLKYREIAVKLSISEKTVEANMGKALKALRNSMEKYEQE